MENQKVQACDEGLLKELGFETAAKEVEAKRIMKRKLMVAYENYRFVTPEQITDFNKKLFANTNTQQAGYITYDQLRFTPVSKYGAVPPMEVLTEVKRALELGCFDALEVADIQTVEKRPDPIVFGRITGSDVRWFISQWDNDVKIEDILKDNEG